MFDNVPQEPIVAITAEAIKDMFDEVAKHPNIETAWGLWGLTLKNVPEFALILGVIKPSENDIERGYANTEFGGPSQETAVRWYQSNWEEIRKQLPVNNTYNVDPANIEFSYLFKGHSHHSLEVYRLSDRDRRSLMEAVDTGLKIAVSPLANVLEPGHVRISKPKSQYSFVPRIYNNPVGVLWVSRYTKIQFKFYYYSKGLKDSGIYDLMLVDPKIISDMKGLPPIPPPGWHFKNEADFQEQLRHMKNYGCEIQVLYREVKKDGPPIEIQFVVKHPKWGDKILMITTSYDYPHTAPEFNVLRGGRGTNQEHFAHMRSLRHGNLWNFGEDFIDAIFRMEARGML